MNVLESYLAFLNESVELADFDKKYFQSLPKHSELLYHKHDCRYHTILYNGEDAGVVGFCWSWRKPEDEGFGQIVIHPDYRGESILEKAYNLLVKKYKLSVLYVSINDKNIASIKSHLRAGFKKASESRQKKLRGLGYLHKGYSRYIKNY